LETGSSKSASRRDRRDVAKRFSFTTIQSPYGMRLAQAFGVDTGASHTPMRSSMAAHLKSGCALTVLSSLPEDAHAVRSAEKVTQCGLRSRRAQPRPDFRKARRVHCARCGHASTALGLA
jgi:hypothetical protein